MANSVITAGVSTIFTIILSVFMAYSFSRFKTGDDNLSFFVCEAVWSMLYIQIEHF